jgi:hypothetical protein
VALEICNGVINDLDLSLGEERQKIGMRAGVSSQLIDKTYAVPFCSLQWGRTPGRDLFTTSSVGRNRGNAE